MGETVQVHNQVQSFGLIYGPGFFEIHCFSDREGKNWIKSETKSGSTLNNDELAEKNPLYSLLFSANWTLIPEPVFNEEDAAIFLSKTTGFKEENGLSFEKSPGLGLVVAYESNPEFESFSTKVNPGLKTGHLTTALLESCRRETVKSPDQVLLFTSENLATLIIFQKENLLFSNSIEFKNVNDLLYFIFFTFNQLELNSEIPFSLMGDPRVAEITHRELKNYFSDLRIKTTKEKLAELLSSVCA